MLKVIRVYLLLFYSYCLQFNLDDCNYYEKTANQLKKSGVNELNIGNSNQARLEPQFSLNNLMPNNLDTLKPKRLHVSNIPFRYRDTDLQQLFSV